MESTTIDLLIGSGILLKVRKLIVLPSGMFLVASKFGYIVTGKFPDHNQCCSYLVCHCSSCT